MLSTAAAIVLGAHLYTHHANKDMRDDTPGIYAVAPGVGVLGGSLTGGVYRNSLGRTSVYLGQSWQSESGRFGLTLALASGYQYRNERGAEIAPPQGTKFVGGPLYATVRTGHTSALLAPIVAPSIAFPEAKPYLLGATPRLSLVGYKHGALHLSLERAF